MTFFCKKILHAQKHSQAMNLHEFDMNLQILLFDKCPLFQHLKHFISLFLSFEVSFLSINSSNVNDFIRAVLNFFYKKILHTHKSTKTHISETK